MKILGILVIFAIFASNIAFEDEKEFELDYNDYDLDYDEEYGFRESWAKVKDAFKKLGEKIKSKSIDLWKKIIPVAGPIIEKYKDVIIKALEHDGKVVIDEGKKIVITVIDDVVKVVIDGLDAMSGKITYDEEENGFADLWEKVKVAAGKIGPKIKEDALKVLKDYKPKILASLKNVSKVIIQAGKEWVIEVRDGIVKIIAGGEEATSSGESFEGNSPISVVYNSPNSKAGDKIKEIWNKVKAAFQKLGHNIADAARRFAEKMAGLGDKISKDTAKIRAKIAELAKKYGEKILKVLDTIINKYKDIIVDALKKDGKVVIEEGKKIVIEIVNDVVKVVVDGIHALGGKYEIASDDVDEEDNGLKEIWEKVKAAVKAYTGKFKEDLEKLVAKYKPRIIDQLKKFKTVVIKEGKGLVIDMLGDAIKIIIRGGIEEDQLDNGFTDMWEKVKATVKKMKGVVVEKTLATLEKYKPKIIDAVKGLKHVVIACGKDLVIHVKDGVIKIIVDGATAVSDGTAATDVYFEGNYIMLIFPDASKELQYSMKSIWAKVKGAFERLGEKIKMKSIDLWNKIIPVAGPILEKYKDLIVKALKHDGQIIINEGKQIVITVINDVVKVIIDGMDAASGKLTHDEEDNGFKELWKKILEAAEKFGEEMKAVVMKVLTFYKPQILDALQNLKKIVIKGAKTLIIEVRDEIIKIISEGHTVTSDGSAIIKGGISDESRSNDFKQTMAEVWRKILVAAEKFGDDIKAVVMKVLMEYMPQILDALQSVKRIVIKAEKMLIIEVRDAIIKIIAEGHTVTSDGSTFVCNCDVYGVIEGHVEADGPLSGIWGRVKRAAAKVPGVFKKATDHVLKKYKDKIVTSLKKIGHFVVDAGHKIGVKIVQDVAKIFVDGLEVASSK